MLEPIVRAVFALFVVFGLGSSDDASFLLHCILNDEPILYLKTGLLLLIDWNLRLLAGHVEYPF